jgi:hypothetical protein
MIHQTADFDLHPGDGWYSAQCTCGFTEGPFPDVETMVDALMEHAAIAVGATSLLRELVEFCETRGAVRGGLGPVSKGDLDALLARARKVLP